jgi:ribulose-phosphate 3-epimerase
MEIRPSIAAANQSCLKDEIARLGEGQVTSLHLDIEDGNFVPNITFGIKTLRDLRGVTRIPFSVHLLVTKPQMYIKELSKIGVDEIAVHIEVCSYPREIIRCIRDNGPKVGLAINPKTSLDDLRYYLDDIDSVLIMTSEPDGRDQQFFCRCLEKVRELGKVKHRNFKIEVDGGIKEKYLRSIWEAGADVVIIGRTVFGCKDPGRRLKRLTKLLLDLEENSR